MSLRAELETWAAALKAYDEEDFQTSLELFTLISDSSKILTNMGLIYATIGEHETAVEQFHSATEADQYLAIAYFQCGVSNFLLGRYELAHSDFDEALLYLRGNQAINYEQLGLKFKLFSAEVLFNKGLSQIYLERFEEGLADMEEARNEKATEEHNVIDDAIQDRGEGYTVFSIPVGVLYRPSEVKLRNAKTKDYLGKAKLVAAADADDAYTTFTGATRLQRGQTISGSTTARDKPTPAPPARAEAAPEPPASLQRSVTVPAPRSDAINPRPSRGAVSNGAAAGLARSKTLLTTAGGPTPARAGAVSRSTSLSGGQARPAPAASGPARGLTIRKGTNAPAASSPRADIPPTPPPADAKAPAPRLTEIYDDYMNGNDEEEASSPILPGRRLASSPTTISSSRAPSSYYPSTVRSGTLRGKKSISKKGGNKPPMSPYEEEEEGYASGDYEEPVYELAKIRVKIHYEDDVRGMTLTPDTQFEEFLEKVTTKFGRALDGMRMQFKDEEGGKVTLRDDSDYELALETVREMTKGKTEGKLEIWCTDM